MSDETIYMGNTQNEEMNESEHKSVIANVWKPITIGGLTGILMGAGALMASNASAANQDNEEASHDDSDASIDVQYQLNDALDEVDIADIEPGLSFEDAFAAARAQIGPGGVFYWHGAIFSTYTVDEWEALTEDEHDHFAMQVQPEVEADQVDIEQLVAIASEEVEDAPITETPVEDIAQDMDMADATPQEAADDVEMAMADVAAQEAADDVEIAMADVTPQEVSDDVEIAMEDVTPQETDDDNLKLDIEAAIADATPQEANDDANLELKFDMEVDEDVQIADFQPERIIEDLALTDVSAKSMGSTSNEAQPQNIAHEFESDDDVRIVGYGEFDGHIVTGLDLDGDNQADIAVIDVDDSGNYSRADIVIDTEGNMSTYGELEDFAREQMPGEDDDHLNEDHAQNPEVAQDMPDYMDDALAQV